MSEKVERVRAVLAELPKGATTEQVQEEYSKRFDGDSISAGTISKVRNGNNGSNGVPAPISADEVEKVSELVAKNGGIAKVGETIAAVERLLPVTGGDYSRLKACVEKVKVIVNSHNAAK